MKLKRYCVTVMDHWTPMRDFWTLEGAKKFYRMHRASANVFKWDGEAWCWMCGAHDRGIILSPTVHDVRLRGTLVSRPVSGGPNG
jgi:hypothetical protein